MSRWLTVKEASAHIHRDESFIREAINRRDDKRLVAYKDPAKIRGVIISEEDLDTWIRNNYQPI